MSSVSGGTHGWNALRGAAAIVLGVAISLASPPAALADPGHGQGQSDGFDPQPIADSGDENFGVPDESLADLAMGDSCKDAGSTTGVCFDSVDDSLIPPGGTTGTTVSCAMVARKDRTNLGQPTDSTYVLNTYLVPSDVTARNFDRPTVCDNGTVSESNIGRSNYNARKWMYTSKLAKSLETRKRTVSAYGRTFSVIDVSYVKLTNTSAYYASNTFTRIDNEMIQRGWSGSYAKHALYAHFRSAADATGTSAAGLAQYGGKRAYAFRTFLYQNAAKTARWGCGDEGDTSPIHETLHLFSIVNPAAADYSSNGGKNPYHAAQTSDVMYWQSKSTPSGYWSDGALRTKSVFDAGADSYTSSLLGKTSYLLGSPGSRDLYVC